MQGMQDFQQQLIKFICGFFFYGILTASIAQTLVTAHRWRVETARQELWIQKNELRFEKLCLDTTQVFDLDFKKQCQEYDEIRSQSASILAAVKIAKEWQICDAEQGGCRGVTGLFAGGVLVLIGILYLLNRAPSMIMRYRDEREMQDVNEFMYTRGHNKYA
jgi:hypothetical protein